MLAIWLQAALLILASDAEAVFEDIARGLQQGRADVVCKHIRQGAELSADDGSIEAKQYTKAEALEQLKAFVASHQPESFDIMHRGQSGDDAFYAIGEYRTADRSFRTYLLLKERYRKLYLQEIRFELIN